MQSPENALSVPMLRKDVDALKLQNEHTAKSLEREIGSAYEIIKWVLGTHSTWDTGYCRECIYCGKGKEKYLTTQIQPTPKPARLIYDVSCNRNQESRWENLQDTS